MKITIAARKSDLARLQAYRVGEALLKAHPSLELNYFFKTSLGDQNQNDPLWKMPQKGVFTEDLKNDLLTGEVDAVVHSWKDLPTEVSSETKIIATLPREDMRDLLLVKEADIESIIKTKKLLIYSSSPRRVHHLNQSLPQLLPFQIKKIAFENIRGNISTRLQKLMSGHANGLVVAKAALDRILKSSEEEFSDSRKICKSTLTKCRWMVMPITECPPAAAQGALAIEILKSKDDDLAKIFNKINCEVTMASVEEERKRLSFYGGGCHQKIGIGVFERSWGKVVVEKGVSDSGQVINALLHEKLNYKIKPVSKEVIFPKSRDEASLYEREEIAFDLSQINEWKDGIFVSRISACPKDYDFKSKIIWTAGIKTWQELAKRGVWVTGSAEGFGETEDPQINTLVQRDLKWLKLGHEGSNVGAANKILATYKLIPKDLPDLSNRTHFYWMSYSAFKLAVQKYPHILNSYNASGPGATHNLLKKHLNSSDRLTVHLSYDDWLSQVVRSH